jgi:hypothetical protein
MRKLFLLLLISALAALTSCRKDFDFEPSSGGLQFSKNTVYLDSIFTGISSSTYRLKVYNRSNKDLSIPKIELGNTNNSKFRLMIDGLTGENGAGKSFNNVEILANDSLFIFIEATADIADANPVDFTYNDKINFYSTNEIQKVDLVAPIRDARFIFPNRPLPNGPKETLIINGEDTAIEGHKLATTEELNWNSDKPYVVYGYAYVPEGETLTIDAGTNVHFHANSGLIIDKNAKIIINGTDDEKVNFQGDRLETSFANVPGQWGIILITSNLDNEINHLTIKNATVGLLLQRSEETTFPKLNITNSRIFNSSNVGMLARTSVVTGNNLVINNAGQIALACNHGGNYNFTHSTFNNNWSSSNQLSVLLNNFIESDNAIFVQDLIAANFTNCIIYGSNQIELLIEKREDPSNPLLFNYKFKNCLIKFNNINNQFTNNAFYNFTNPSIYENCSIALNGTQFRPRFESIIENKLWLQEHLNLPADESTIGTSDIKGVIRTIPIDLGAYQYVP